jgi:hypothetical protein
MQLFYANQSIRNVRDISNATHDRPIPSIGTIYFKISGVRYSWLHSNSQCIDLCFFKLNIGNKYRLCSELKKNVPVCFRPGAKLKKKAMFYLVIRKSR